MSDVTSGAPPQAAAPGTRSRKLDRSLVEGPIVPAVWKMAWPTVLQNAIGGLQGIIDHAMVGHYVGFTGNAAIGVSWQIFLVVIVFIASLFTGMGVLVASLPAAGARLRRHRRRAGCTMPSCQASRLRRIGACRPSCRARS